MSKYTFKYGIKVTNEVKDASPRKCLPDHKGTNAQNFVSFSMCEPASAITSDMVSVAKEALLHPLCCPYTGLLRE